MDSPVRPYEGVIGSLVEAHPGSGLQGDSLDSEVPSRVSFSCTDTTTALVLSVFLVHHRGGCRRNTAPPQRRLGQITREVAGSTIYVILIVVYLCSLLCFLDVSPGLRSQPGLRPATAGDAAGTLP